MAKVTVDIPGSSKTKWTDVVAGMTRERVMWTTRVTGKDNDETRYSGTHFILTKKIRQWWRITNSRKTRF